MEDKLVPKGDPEVVALGHGFQYQLEVVGTDDDDIDIFFPLVTRPDGGRHRVQHVTCCRLVGIHTVNVTSVETNFQQA